MDLKELEAILSENSENKFCPICSTPFKPYHSRQKTCGSPECKKAYHAEYVKNYNKRFREENPIVAKRRRRESMRRFREKSKTLEGRNDDLGKQLEYWEKREEFDRKVAAYGAKYGEVSAQKTLEQVPKIDTTIGGERNDAVSTEDKH